MGDSIVGPCSRVVLAAPTGKRRTSEEHGGMLRGCKPSTQVRYTFNSRRFVQPREPEWNRNRQYDSMGMARKFSDTYFQIRSAIPRAKRDATPGNWASLADECSYLVANLVDANNPRLRAYALICWSAFTKHWQFCCRAVSEKSAVAGAIAAASSMVCEQ